MKEEQNSFSNDSSKSSGIKGWIKNKLCSLIQKQTAPLVTAIETSNQEISGLRVQLEFMKNRQEELWGRLFADLNFQTDVIVAAENRCILETPKFASPKRLERHGFKAYSQNEEDGIIHEIFRRIGVENKTFVEFGVGDGFENNTLYLLKQGWKGLWLEASPKSAANIRKCFKNALDEGQLSFKECFINRENINSLLAGWNPDMLGIDIDGNDYWVWGAIDCMSPRLVVIEYNPKFLPSVKWTMTYDANHEWQGDDYHGASLAAMAELGKKKGYTLVGCSLTGVNAFFVRNDLVEDKFYTSEDCADFYYPSKGWIERGYRLEGYFPPRKSDPLKGDLL